MRFLDPKQLQGSLIRAGMYLAIWELLTKEIIERPISFFSYELDLKSLRPLESDDYRRHVSSLHREKLTASMLWLKSNGAIDDADMEMLNSLRILRNEIAHEICKYFDSSANEIKSEDLESAKALAKKISRWWVREVEIPTNPDFDGEILTEESFQSGLELSLDMLTLVANGEDLSYLLPR